MKNFKGLAFLCVYACTIALPTFAATKPEPALQIQLEAKRKASKADVKTAAIMSGAIEKLRKEKITERAKKEGDVLPDFTLTNASGEKVKLADLRKTGPVIVTFYRGAWCPYCKIQLMEYQKHWSEWKKKGATLVAISPEVANLSQEFAEKSGLTFDLLADSNNAYATQVGLVYGIEKDLKQVYENFGIDLENSQGNTAWKLPVSATYVVGKDGKIAYSFLDVDYTKRAEPSEIKQAIERVLQKKN